MGAPESGDIPIDEGDVVVEEAPRPSGPTGKHERTPTATIVRNMRDLPSVATYGRYELLGRLAFGGMAEIFLARERTAAGSARMLVVKRILPHVADDDGFVQMFLGEARIAMRLAHPGIVHLYEFGEEGGTWFIAMEWVNGVSLGRLIKRARDASKAGPEAVGPEGAAFHRTVPPVIAAKVISLVAEALHHAHTALGDDGEPLGIVHRDVSPQNVMIAYDGHVKLLDFGVAKARTATTRTDAGIVKGKLAYMAPEQCRGADVDARADVFALGVCLYEALAGRHLHARANDFETMKAVMEMPVPSARADVPAVPEALDAIMQRALAKDPDARYQSAGDLVEALEGFLVEQHERITPGRIASVLAQLFAEDIARGPQLQTAPRDSLVPVSAAGRVMQSGQAPAVGLRQSMERTPVTQPAIAEPKKSGALKVLAWVALLGFGAVGLCAVGGLGLAWQRGMFARDWSDPAVVPPVAPPHDATPVPPVTPPPVATTGGARFESTPSGATVLIDDVAVPGTTPVTVGALAPGVHAVEVHVDGRPPWTSQIDVEPGETAQVVATLAGAEHVVHHVAAPPGTLAINTRPWSKVYLGARLLGTTPIGNAEVPSGDVSLRLVDRDGETHRVHVHVGAGEHQTAFFDLANPEH